MLPVTNSDLNNRFKALYLVQTHEVTGDPTTGNHLFKLVLEDILPKGISTLCDRGTCLRAVTSLQSQYLLSFSI
jgi:hypothetical protein